MCGKSRSDDPGLRGPELKAEALWFSSEKQGMVPQDRPASLEVLSAVDSLEMEHRSLLLVVFHEPCLFSRDWLLVECYLTTTESLVHIAFPGVWCRACCQMLCAKRLDKSTLLIQQWHFTRDPVPGGPGRSSGADDQFFSGSSAMPEIRSVILCDTQDTGRPIPSVSGASPMVAFVDVGRSPNVSGSGVTRASRLCIRRMK